VHLAHFYEIDHERKMGIVAIFLDVDPNRNRWSFLYKLICHWREVEEGVREECGLASVPAYPGCRNPTRQGNDGNLPIQCSAVNNPFRMCKPNSCCESVASTSAYCQEVYHTTPMVAKWDPCVVGTAVASQKKWTRKLSAITATQTAPVSSVLRQNTRKNARNRKDLASAKLLGFATREPSLSRSCSCQ
jgi:hypothetical protein